ncbi:ubiquitin-protein ligase E3C [Halyomorpha halys]|uniref:ubiquitin-protein ligase E3C n=1 Tax=Halyomorpha halys TaxID=286706 RepID=UPI0006D51F97|nr:ubiquitin-protein ligase E3C [Halyomorpha halys]
MDKQRYFEGDYRRMPSQNLAGASRQSNISEVLDKAQYERKKRETNRLELEKATIMQATFRGRRCRKQIAFQLKTELTNKISELRQKLQQSVELNLDDIKCIISYLRLIYPRNIPWNSTTLKDKQDCEQVVFISSVVSNYKKTIIHAMVENSDWMWRVIYLLSLGLHWVKSLPTNLEKKTPLFLKMMKGFLDPDIYIVFEPSKDTSCLLRTIWEKLLSNGLFKTLVMIIDNRNSLPQHVFYNKTLIYIKDMFIIILHLVISSKNIDFCQTSLKLLSEEIICKEMTVETKRLVFSCFNDMEKFPMQTLIKVILDLNNDELYTIHALHNFLSFLDSDEIALSIEEEKKYILLLSKLSVNIPLCVKSLKPIKGTTKTNHLSREENLILNECLSLINSPKKSERLVNMLLGFIQRNDDDGLFWFSKCIYHIWFNDSSPIYKYRLIRKVAFQPCFLKALWNFINNEKRVLSFSSPVYSASVLSMLSSGVIITPVEADRIMPAVTMFCFLLKNHISLLSDELLYEEELLPEGGKDATFTLSEVVSISKVLKEVAVGIISLAFPSITMHGVEQRIDVLTPTKHVEFNTLAWKTLLEQIVSLLRLLHNRDSRRQFSNDASFWLSNALQDLNQSLSQFKRIEIVSPFSTAPGSIYRAFTVYENRYLTTIRTLPFTIGFIKRFTFYQSYIAENKLEYQNPAMHFLQVPHLLVRIRRDYLYEDAFEKICFEPEIRIHLKVHLISSLGVEEPGIDGGGLFREFIMEFLKTAFDPNRGFFILNRDNEFYPNPNIHMICDDFRTHYFFIGKMLGKALFENVLVEVPLADFFLSEIMGHSNELCINGLATLDPDLYKNLISLTCYKGDLSELGLDFTLTLNDFGESRAIELKQNGRNTPVNEENVLEYIHLVAQYKAYTQIEEQTKSFFAGLDCVISLEWLRMFTTKELQLIISGNKSPIDVDDMKEHTVYSGGYSAQHPTIVMFWNVVKSFDNLQKSLLLRFVTSCSRPPLLGFKELYPPLCIQLVESDDNRLPSSSTCMNILKLPEFTNENVMKERLLYAIQSGSGFELI